METTIAVLVTPKTTQLLTMETVLQGSGQKVVVVGLLVVGVLACLGPLVMGTGVIRARQRKRNGAITGTPLQAQVRHVDCL